jgi:hypothetical protein
VPEFSLEVHVRKEFRFMNLAEFLPWICGTSLAGAQTQFWGAKTRFHFGTLHQKIILERGNTEVSSHSGHFLQIIIKNSRTD